jgi:hypothetical protein
MNELGKMLFVFGVVTSGNERSFVQFPFSIRGSARCFTSATRTACYQRTMCGRNGAFTL